MSHVDEIFPELIRQRLEALGTTPFAVETANGLPADAVRNVLRGGGKAGPTLSRVREVCDALGLELYIGPPRASDRGAIAAAVGAEFASIPIHDAALAAGTGQENSTEPVIGHLAFRRDWLERVRVSPANAVLAHVEGDSMLPSIHPRDLVLIDRSKRDIPYRKRSAKDTRPSPIFALLDNGRARVKRIERPEPDLVILQSDNPAYGPEFRTDTEIESLNIIGKVVWWGHTVRE